MAATPKKMTDAERLKIYEKRIENIKTRQQIAELRAKLKKK